MALEKLLKTRTTSRVDHDVVAQVIQARHVQVNETGTQRLRALDLWPDTQDSADTGDVLDGGQS